MVSGFSSGELSPVEVASEHLDAIGAGNAAINAYCLVDADSALADARASAQRYATGRPLGPLDGVPVSIKDLLLTAGWPTLRGSELIEPDDLDWNVDA
ncbi:amidase, partial [Streptomyces sp. SID10244]|nr:amidase [Streptomyces sp. SID10244]